MIDDAKKTLGETNDRLNKAYNKVKEIYQMAVRASKTTINANKIILEMRAKYNVKNIKSIF